MAVPDKSRWTRTAQLRDAPMSRFNSVGSATVAILWVLARHLEAITHPLGQWPGRGYDPASAEHARRALDWMVSSRVGRRAADEGRKAYGDQTVAWLIRHADALNIRHIIWNRRIWKRRYRGTGTEWTAITNRSGVSDWHEDHIHIYLDDTAGYVPDAPLGVGTIDQRPGLPSTGVSTPTWDGKSYPGQALILSGGKQPAVQYIQERLVAHGYDPGAIDGYWGDKTRTALAAFQRAQGWTGDGADGLPGPTTWALLTASIDPLEEIMSWYKDRDEFEKALRDQAQRGANAAFWDHVVPDNPGHVISSSWRNNVWQIHNALGRIEGKLGDTGNLRQTVADTIRAELAKHPDATPDEIAKSVAAILVDGVEVTVAAKQG